MNKSDLCGLTAVVFGASGHVGADIAVVLAEHGARVAVQYRTGKDAAQRVTDTILGAGGQAFPVMCDALDENSVTAAYRQAAARFGSCDIVVNAVHEQAGMSNVEEMEWRDWIPHINALKSNFYICRGALAYLRQSGNGRIIYISGGLSKRLYPGASAYSAVKGGINNFCKTLALEEAAHGTTVNIVAPGRVEPSDLVNSVDQQWQKTDRDWRYATPLPHSVTARDVGETVAYYASPAAACITGQTIYVAGGEIIP